MTSAGPVLDIGIHPDHPVSTTVHFAQQVERAGFAGLWVADSQDLFRDCFVSLTAVALGTSSLRLATGVTNPVLRDASVIAGGLASLDEVVPGRVSLGLGSGETAVQTAGRRPATIAEMAVAIKRCREVFEHPWHRGPRRVPIVLAATGPRALRLAGRLADGAYLKIGCDPDVLGWGRHQIEAGSETRQVATPCRMTLMLGVGLGATMEEAYREVAGFAAATAAAVHHAVPEDAIPRGLREPLAEVARMVARARAESSYGDWLDDPALVGNLPRRVLEGFCIAGTDPTAIAEQLASLPVETVVMPLLTNRRDDQLEQLASAVGATQPVHRGRRREAGLQATD